MGANLGGRFQKTLFEAAIRLDQRLYGKTAHKPRWYHEANEIFFNLAGILVGFLLLHFPPARFANFLTAAIALLKSGRFPAPSSEESSKNLEAAGAAARDWRAKHGAPPRVLILMSHPETSGEESRLLGDMVYRAVQAGNAVAPRSKFKLLQAIDSFALDNLPWFLSETYAGLIAGGHLAVDRLPEDRTLLQAALFKRFYYSRSIFHLLRALRRKKTICAALGGGVIHNTRILYTVREFACRIYGRLTRRGASKQDFAIELVSLLSRGELSACATGRLSPGEREELNALLKERWADGPAALSLALQEFEEELGLATPFRLRLFKIIFKRICARGMPLLLIPLRHSQEASIDLAPCALLTNYDPKSGELTLWEPPDPAQRKEKDSEFIERFVRGRLNALLKAP